ncbi:MAG: 5-formyltetrahydrofolate cyclo-ligase [Clostridia bacterium]|nr:5-formyltetrahydrofolate cyclo-ligase [Clostridia bacterium]
MEKQELRRMMREKKRAMTEEEINRQSAVLAERFFAHPAYKQATAIFAYLSYNQEVRTAAILEQAQRDGKRVAVPKVFGEEMKFLWLDDLTAIAPGAFHIPEPIADGPEAEDETALVLMPGLAFDPQGRRCGYGGGFYDKFLAAHRQHPTLALCYDFQLLPELKTDAHDLPVDYVIAAGGEDEGK